MVRVSGYLVSHRWITTVYTRVIYKRYRYRISPSLCGIQGTHLLSEQCWRLRLRIQAELGNRTIALSLIAHFRSFQKSDCAISRLVACFQKSDCAIALFVAPFKRAIVRSLFLSLEGGSGFATLPPKIPVPRVELGSVRSRTESKRQNTAFI